MSVYFRGRTQFNPFQAVAFVDLFGGCTARHARSWFPDQGLNPGPLAVEAWSLHDLTAREVSGSFIFSFL